MSSQSIRTLCLGICRAREESSLQKVVLYFSSHALVGLLQETIVMQQLQLKIAHIIIGDIFLMLFGNFKAYQPL